MMQVQKFRYRKQVLLMAMFIFYNGQNNGTWFHLMQSRSAEEAHDSEMLAIWSTQPARAVD